MIANRRPDPRLRLDPDALGLAPRGRAFFRRGTVAVARSLVGDWIARRWRGRWYGGHIVETEAYLGERDRAAHSWGGRSTPRVEPMYGDGGHLYVFLVYGMHSCANVVTRREGQPEAVLLRAAEGPPGAPPRLMSGPGKLCEALGITVADSGADLLGDVLRVFAASEKRPRLTVAARIGVDYAGEAKDWPLRFYDSDSAAVSVWRERTP
ncbi:MAG TPA: DNA-3-methyladenine glycosylase [Thermoanaerobaculia bacterium]|nr:DNA-3-methyladenine glycosylase [Thermoanaerobaculia bacterium]